MQINTDPSFIVKPSNGGYTLFGQTLDRISSVAKILDKPAIVPWAVGLAIEHLEEQPLDFEGARKAHVKYLNDRARYGTEVHYTLEKWAERCIKENGGVPIQPEPDPFSVVWQTWNYMNKRNLRIVAVEVPVYDKERMVGGRFDLLYEIMGHEITGEHLYGVIDFKNYKGFYNRAVEMQLGKYADCVTQLSGEKIIECVAMRFSKNNPVEIVYMDIIRIRASVAAFNSALELLRYGVLDQYKSGSWCKSTTH